jgi:hypothetical protein
MVGWATPPRPHDPQHHDFNSNRWGIPYEPSWPIASWFSFQMHGRQQTMSVGHPVWTRMTRNIMLSFPESWLNHAILSRFMVETNHDSKTLASFSNLWVSILSIYMIETNHTWIHTTSCFLPISMVEMIHDQVGHLPSLLSASALSCIAYSCLHYAFLLYYHKYITHVVSFYLFYVLGQSRRYRLRWAWPTIHRSTQPKSGLGSEVRQLTFCHPISQPTYWGYWTSSHQPRT